MFKMLIKKMMHTAMKKELEKIQPVLDYLHNLDPRKPVVVVEEKKKNYTWLIVLGVVLGLVAVGVIVYKLFFEVDDDFDDFDDEDFEDIDFDEDYDEEFDDFDEDEDLDDEE